MNLYRQFLLICLGLAFFLPYTGFSQESDLSLRLKGDSTNWNLLVANLTLAPLHLIIQNKSDGQPVIDMVIEPKDSMEVMSLGSGLRKVVADEFNQSHKFKYYLGRPDAVHDDHYLYRLPFGADKAVEVGQSFNGKFSHNTSISRFAIDFSLKIGEPVYAAREGLVVKVEEHFNEHGGEEFRFKANRILILHSDGTIASYVHLDFEGSLVEEGEYVKKGQKIGVSGFTGFARGPHLHFVVRRGYDQAVPIYFEGYSGKVLRKGKKYLVR